jgi:hypothetical protein
MLVPEGFEAMTAFFPEPNRTLWIFFTLFHPVKTLGVCKGFTPAHIMITIRGQTTTAFPP